MKLSELLKRIRPLPFKAKAAGIYDRDNLLVADANTSCGLTREMDLAHAEYLTLAANTMPELVKKFSLALNKMRTMADWLPNDYPAVAMVRWKEFDREARAILDKLEGK